MPLTGGELEADFPSGKVKYQNLTVSGLALPREVALGMAFKLSDDWLLSFKVNWINWADAIKSINIHASNPSNSLAPAVYPIPPNAQDWKNQVVLATGVAYNLDNLTTLYGGYNYGRNPVPTQNSSALLAAILEHHLTLGAARQISQEWKMTGGLEYMFPAKVDYTSPLFGNAEVRNEAVFFHLMFSRRW